MNNEEIASAFLASASQWACDGYVADVRYLAGVRDGQRQVWSAVIWFYPLVPESDLSFSIDSPAFSAGRFHYVCATRQSMIDLLMRASAGAITLPHLQIDLPADNAFEYSSEIERRDRFYCDLHLRICGAPRPELSTLDIANIDSVLRSAELPFDGMEDVAAWLGLPTPWATTDPRSITVRVGPPIDLIVDRCRLADDILSLVVHAQGNFDIGEMGIAVRATPGDEFNSRCQAKERINWGEVCDGKREGSAEIRLKRADNALAILMIGQSAVRRHWFIDSTRARNNRFLSVQHFDRDLKMIRQAVLDSPDSSKFELGVSAVLFLLGFSPCVQVETDSPDLIVMTPGGRLVVVECTIRIADVHSKIGKLVDRREALTRTLKNAEHPTSVAAALVCRMPRNQIAADARDLAAHQIILIPGEELTSAFDRVRFPSEPDKMLLDALNALGAPIVPN